MVMWLKALIVAISTAVGIGSVVVLKQKHDNPVEEVAESIIKEETGISVDLTPSSPEVNKDEEDGTPEEEA